MEMKIMFAGAILVGGWVLYYLFGRQFAYNIRTAFHIRRNTCLLAGMAFYCNTFYSYVRGRYCYDD